MNLAIQTCGLGKRHRTSWALRDCGLAIPAGKVAALVGPNGAGKTTLLHILAGLSEPSAGTVNLLGPHQAGSPAARERVAFVAQDAPLYPDLRVCDLLRVAGNLNMRWDQTLAVQRLDGFGIPMRRKAGQLSGGQQSQLAITLALARRPDLLLLDEPMARLDPLARHDFLSSLLTTTYETGLSVVFSSHVVAELERVATYLVVLLGGRVQIAGSADGVMDGHRVLTGPVGEVDALAGRLGAVDVRRAGRQAHMLVRYRGEPPPGWDSRQVGIEEVVLGYLRNPGATMLPGPLTSTAGRTGELSR